jgi:hypothetical protein
MTNEKKCYSALQQEGKCFLISIETNAHGWNSQLLTNFLSNPFKIFITLGQKILKFVRLIFEADIMKSR